MAIALALMKMKKTPRATSSSCCEVAAGSYGAPYVVLRLMMRWRLTLARSAISVSRGFMRRICEPSGTSRPAGSPA